MDHVPTSQLYNDHIQRQPQPAPLFTAPNSRALTNSHKPPTHPSPITYHPQHHQQQTNPWREVAAVSLKRLYPQTNFPTPPTSHAPRPDTSSFTYDMFTTLAVNPDASTPTQSEPPRPLNPIQFTASRSDNPITHVSAVSGAGTVTVSAAIPPTSSALPRTHYPTENFYPDMSRQDRTFTNNYNDRQQHFCQQEMLPRPHSYHPPSHPLQTQDSHVQYPHSLPRQPAPLDNRHPPYHPHHEDTQGIHQMHPLPDSTALSRHSRLNPPNVFRADGSMPATPTTPATSATQPFSATPSSPDNNGASSNGSVPREHACTYPGCTKTFDRRYNLTVHYRRHTNEMPYPCKFPGCPQKFKWRSSQSHHMKTRHQVSGAGRLPRNNSMRQTGNTTGINGLSTAGSTGSPMIPNGMPPSHAPIIGLVPEDDTSSTYKRTFSPRKRQRSESHTS